MFKHNCVYPVTVILDGTDVEASEQPYLTTVGIPDGAQYGKGEDTFRRLKLG